MTSCDGVVDDVSAFFYNNWSVANTAIATVDYYGTHSGVSVGSTTSSSWAQLQGEVGRNSCPILKFQPGGGDNVTPMILLGGSNGTNITNTTQSVVVGQQIVLYASYSGVSVSSQSWSVPGTIVAGYTASASSGSVSTNVTLDQQSTTFYWVLAGNSQTVTFTLNYGNNQTAKAQATFNISAPSPATPTVTLPTNGQLYINTFTECSNNPSFVLSVRQYLGSRACVPWTLYRPARHRVLTPHHFHADWRLLLCAAY